MPSNFTIAMEIANHPIMQVVGIIIAMCLWFILYRKWILWQK